MPRKIIAKTNNDERMKRLLSAIMDISPDEIGEVRISESRPERELPPCIEKIDELDARITAIERILRLS